MMKHISNNSRSPSVRGSDISLTSSSSSSLSDDERPRGDMDHDQHHQLARHVWDRYTSSSELGKRTTPGDDDKKPSSKLSSKLSSSSEPGKRSAPGDDDKKTSKLSEEDSKKTGLSAAATGYNALQCGQFI